MSTESQEGQGTEPEGSVVASTMKSSIDMLKRTCATVVNLLLFSAAINPDVPPFLYWVVAGVGVGYIVFSGPVLRDRNSRLDWDAEAEVIRITRHEDIVHTRLGFVFSVLHEVLQTVGSIWLLMHCVRVARSSG